MTPSPFSRRPCSGPWPLAGVLVLAALLASPPAGAAFALQDSGQWFGEARSQDVALADLDGDGDTDDAVDEGEETVGLSLSGPYGDGTSPEPEVGTPAAATLAITEETGGGSSGGGGGGGGGGCALDHEGRGSPGLLILLALMGSLGLLRRRVRPAR